jgi:carboxymethylenebutenolidase
MRPPSVLTRRLALALLSCSAMGAADEAQPVSFSSAGNTLHGVIYRPAGPGPFPALLYNHGSAPGNASDAAFARLAPVFVAHGWVFFAPYRRGQGSSSAAGAYIGAQIERARAEGGVPLAADTMVRLLSTDHLEDQLAGLHWLRQQPYIAHARIAVMGNSFGGIESLLGAARADYCAAVDAAGGAESWTLAPQLRDTMQHAALAARAPVLFLQAQNDYSVEPSRTLYAAMQAAGKPAELHLYPPFGTSAADGHSFSWRGVELWQDDVLRFLATHCTPSQPAGHRRGPFRGSSRAPGPHEAFLGRNAAS